MTSGSQLGSALAIVLMLAACSPDPQDEIRDRIAQDLKDAGRGTSDAEREAVATALAGDLVSIGEDAAAAADDQARATKEIEARYGTVEDHMANECRELRQSLAALEQIRQAPSAGEIRADDEIAAIPAEIERTEARIRETCGG